jgi:hypothetical protein
MASTLLLTTMVNKTSCLPDLLLQLSLKVGMVIEDVSHTYVLSPQIRVPLVDDQPAWTQEANIPLSKEEIEDVLIDLANKFGFQKGESPPLVL